MAPPSEVYRRVGTRLGVGDRWGRGCPRQVPNDGVAPSRHRPRSGSLKIRPIRTVEGGGGTGGRGVGGRGWGKVGLGKVK
jgi:hypothetical protein